MKLPPKKYMDRRHFAEAMCRMRQWLRQGISVKAIVRYYLDLYRLSHDESIRQQILMLIASAIDFSSPDLAMKWCEICNLEMFSGYSAGESMSVRMEETGVLKPRLREFAPSEDISRMMNGGGNIDPSLKVVDPSMTDKIVEISAKRSVYAYRHRDSSLELIILNGCNQDILVDEEAFGGDYPRYFTESTNFHSPLARLATVSHILNHILTIVGYPSLRIGKTACFTSPDGNLINLGDYADAEHGRFLMRRHEKGYFINSPANLRTDPTTAPIGIIGLDNTLICALAATRTIYSRLSDNEFTGSLGIRKLNALVSSCGIFI